MGATKIRDRTRGWLACGALCLLAGACGGSSRPFWRAGGEYTLTLVARERPELIPSIRQYHEPIRDTLALRLTVDSVRGGTAYGRWDGNLRGFAIRVGSPAPAGKDFRVEAAGDSVRGELAPEVTDAGLLMDGVMRGGTVSGRWVTEGAPRTRGVFTITRR